MTRYIRQATKKEREIPSAQPRVYCVMDRIYGTREHAQMAVDAICDAGYGIAEIEEYSIDEIDNSEKDRRWKSAAMLAEQRNALIDFSGEEV